MTLRTLILLVAIANAQPLRPITRMHSFDFSFTHQSFVKLPEIKAPEIKIPPASLAFHLESKQLRFYEPEEKWFLNEFLEHLSVHNLWKIFDGGR